MTGQDIYELASSFLYEKNGEDADSKGFALAGDRQRLLVLFRGRTQLLTQQFLTVTSK